MYEQGKMDGMCLEGHICKVTIGSIVGGMAMKRTAVVSMALFFLFSFCQPMMFAEAKTINQLQQEKKKYEQNKQNAKDSLQQVQAKQKTINEEISQLDQSVAKAQAELDAVTGKLEETQRKLEESTIQLEEATQKKDKQMDTFKQRIKYIHENGDVGYLQTILSAQSLSDLLLRMQYVNDIMEYDKNTLEELKKNQEIIRIKKDEIQVERDQVSLLVEEEKQKNQELQAKLEEKKQAFAVYQQDAAKYEQELESWEKAGKEVESLIAQAAREAEAARQKAAAQQAKNTTSKSKTSSSSSGGGSYSVEYKGGQFAWPVPGRSNISSGYGYRNRPIGSGREFHTGYDIPGPYGTNIVAAADGRVIKAGYVNGYGYTVMIDHGGGLVTLYGHNSKLVVSNGDTVTKGQTIAKCGSTGNSTGNHCHFEVRLNGKHTSPKPYLGV